MHRIECITRSISCDQPTCQYDQLQIHVDRRKSTHDRRWRMAAFGQAGSQRRSHQFRSSPRWTRSSLTTLLSAPNHPISRPANRGRCKASASSYCPHIPHAVASSCPSGQRSGGTTMVTKTTIRTGKSGKTSITKRTKTSTGSITRTTNSKGKTRTTVTTRSGSTTRTRVY